MVSKGWSFDGASMVEEKGRKSNVREREKLMNFWLSEERERGFLF